MRLDFGGRRVFYQGSGIVVAHGPGDAVAEFAHLASNHTAGVGYGIAPGQDMDAGVGPFAQERGEGVRRTLFFGGFVKDAAPVAATFIGAQIAGAVQTLDEQIMRRRVGLRVFGAAFGFGGEFRQLFGETAPVHDFDFVRRQLARQIAHEVFPRSIGCGEIGDVKMRVRRMFLRGQAQ